MDAAQAELFGSFPRRVGTPKQHWVYSAAQFEHFIDSVQGRRNAYATVSQLLLDSDDTKRFTPVSDKVLFDLDGDKTAFPDDATVDERISMMRSDPDLADDVLGDVCDDAQKLARASADDGIPVIGVFSGFGIHVHQLYQPTEDPQVPMSTCGTKYIVEEGIETADWAVVGDVQRICRVPNVQRMTTPGKRWEVLDGRATGLYTIPLAADELRSLDPQWLLEESTDPRQLLIETDAATRPQMPIWEEHRDGPDEDDVDLPSEPLDGRTVDLDDDGLEDLLWELIGMPCMVERLLQPNPEHHVRFNAAVLLYNVGLQPRQVDQIYRRLGWVDYDRATTLYHLKDIWQEGYADMSCDSIREKRLCTRGDDPKACTCYGWSNGRAEWKA